jgi:hypothetical protein
MVKAIIKIMSDYQCFPLWKIDDFGVENVSPNELPITEALKEMLMDWQNKYDSTLNMSNPISSGFKSDIEENNFEEQGLEIWQQMLLELGDSYRVKYFSIKSGVLLDLPSELRR